MAHDCGAAHVVGRRDHHTFLNAVYHAEKPDFGLRQRAGGFDTDHRLELATTAPDFDARTALGANRIGAHHRRTLAHLDDRFVGIVAGGAGADSAGYHARWRS